MSEKELDAEALKKRKEEGKEKLLKLKFAKATVADLTDIFNLGIETDFTDAMGKTPFIKAVSANNIEAAKYLIGRHINTNALDLTGRTGLMICVENKQTEIAELILQSGHNINYQSPYTGFTAITHAVLKNQLEMVNWLIEHKANVDSEDKLGWTPLMHAALYGYTDIVKTLLKNGADKSHQEHGFVRKDQWLTALDIAEQYKYADIVELLN